MARHASPKNLTGRRALAALATAGVALGVGAGAASAAVDTPVPVGSLDAASGVQGTLGALPYVTGAVSALKPNPLAGTGVDPLDNGVGTQLADFQPLTSQALTGPVAQAQSVGTVPLVGDVAKVLG
ncbi:hypothetical protein ABZ584_26030 [Streptomyces antibioticus]|uniref:hypothetical protein n=1 Tax=Streptomyces antibioticus TaxID=1890 RepID=UPI0033C232ED